MQNITPFLWFDNNAEEAVNFYCSVFKDASIGNVQRFPEGMPGPAGEVMTIEFTLNGLNFFALNGGPMYKFSEATSFMIHCDGQEEFDHYWNHLTSNGGEESMCGWLKDRYGVSWQVTPKQLMEALMDPDPERAGRATQAMLQMRRIDIAAIQEAANG